MGAAKRGLFGPILAAGTLLAGLAPAGALDLKVERETWTADQLEQDFIAQFGEDVDACYEGYAFQAGPSAPGGPERTTKRWKRAIVAIDASGSMRAKVAGREKMAAAKDAVAGFLAAAPKDADVGLVAFGHKGSSEEAGKARSCAGVDLLIEPGRAGASEVAAAMGGLDAVGWTPLAAAIALAGKSFTPSDTAGEQVVFVVSDGVETCGGDPVAAARALRASDVKALVNVIGFDLKGGERAALEAVAKAGGGGFSAARDAAEIRARLLAEAKNARVAATFEASSTRVAATNAARAVRVAAAAKACVVRRASGETARFARVGAELERAGKVDRSIVGEVSERLERRSRERLAAADAFEAKIKAELDAANAPIEAGRERVREEHGR